MGPRLLATIGLTVLGGGCTLLVDTDGLGRATAVSAADGGAADASGSDAGGPDGADTSTPEAGPDPCAGNPVHCETFDAPDALARYTQDTDPTTAIALDDTLSFSAPRSAKFEILPSTTNGSPDATLGFRTATPLDAFELEGYVHIAREEPVEVARLLRVASPTGDVVANLNRNGALRDTSKLLGNVGAVPAGRWVRVHVEVRAGRLTATVEGADPSTTEIAFPWTNAELVVRFGVSEANSPTTGWLVRWDNIVVRAL